METSTGFAEELPQFVAKTGDILDIDPTELNVAQQAALQAVINKLTKRIATKYIFCFALQRHESHHKHCFVSQSTKRRLSINILLVYADDEQRTLVDIQHLANSFTIDECQCAAVVIRHADAMGRFAASDAFVCNVFRYGALLYSQNNVLPNREGFVCHRTLLQQTREGWRRWFNNSCQFMDCAAYCLAEHNFCLAVFMLHQTVEQACKAMLKVMLYMRPNTHNLAWMLKLCSTLAPEIATVFPQDHEEDKALFRLLKESYNDCRYAAGFNVKEEEAWAIYYRVSSLMHIAGELCNRRIADMERLLQ